MPRLSTFRMAMRIAMGRVEHVFHHSAVHANLAQSIDAHLSELQRSVSAWQSDGTQGWQEHDAALRQMRNTLASAMVRGSAGAIHDLTRLEQDARRAADRARRARPIAIPDWGQLNTQFIPGWESMTEAQRAQAAQDVSAKLARGRQIWQRISADDFDPHAPPGPSREDVSDLAFYLRARSEAAAGKAWMRGALTIPDEYGRIRTWLDHATGHVYTRDSSHLTSADQARAGGQGRGIDFEMDGDLRERLPYGMRTLLYQRLVRDGHEMLYMKMETEGARFNPVHQARLGRGDGPDAAAIRPLARGDVPEAIRHLKNLLITEKDNSGLARKGEKYGDLPADLRDGYEQLRDLARGLHDSTARAILEQGVSTDRHGDIDKLLVSDMARNVETLELYLRNDAVPAAVRQQLGQALEGWDAAAAHAWGSDYGADLRWRVGNEVIVRRDHLD